MTPAEEIISLLEKLPDIKSRKLRMKKLKDFPSNQEWYSWVINEWIPGQPDYKDLMNLMILLDLDIRAFIYALYGRLEEFETK